MKEETLIPYLAIKHVFICACICMKGRGGGSLS